MLKRGIEAKITTLGFDAKGNVAEANKPRLVQGGCLWNGAIHTEGFCHQWLALYRRVQEKGIREVYEEAAYTWFNRLMAIRILQKNQLCEPVLDYADAARTPRIVDEARMGRMPQMGDDDRARLTVLLDDDTKTTEQFALLVTAFCHQSPIISACFGRMQDYTQLLLPLNILAEGGFVDMINHSEFITDDDYRSSELIGWLYQFYISERKDEVFAKKGKFEADEIPAATQIFTPNWIVKYMVQNTVGRIYLDNNPWDADELKARWQYLVDQSEPTPDTDKYVIKELEDLRVADLSCGSGHILNECFDLLYDLYIREGYSRADAITNIFRCNLTGVDIDTRAKQLATFALLLKACQRDASFADAHCLPNVLDMSGVVPAMTEQELKDACVEFVGGYEDVAGELLVQDFEVLRDADNLGSIMWFCDDPEYLEMLRYHYDDWTSDGIDECPDELKPLLPGVRVILALTTNYSALVMNPPYMGNGNMNKTLSEYVKTYYEEGKADLFSTFMVLAIRRLAPNGKYGMINMHSWMFLSSFEKLRKTILDNYHIENLLHLGPRTFDELSGEVVQNAAFVIGKTKPANGTYYRLVDGKNCADKERMFLNGEGYYPNVSQQNFEKIPGCPIGYWVSEQIVEAFGKEKLLANIANPRKGLVTLDDARFIHFWFEAEDKEFQKPGVDKNIVLSNNRKWVVCNKGGGGRKHYGLNSYVLYWKDNGKVLKDYIVEKYNGGSYTKEIRSENLYFLDGITWSGVTSGNPTFRYFEAGGVFSSSGPSAFPSNNKLYILALLNSNVSATIFKLLSPTLSVLPGDIAKMPIKYQNVEQIEQIDADCIDISKQDWDAHETSWDFSENELVALSSMQGPCTGSAEPLHSECKAPAQAVQSPCTNAKPTLQQLVAAYHEKWEDLFMQLHKNEEELNRQFIDIYGLQDELTPDVPLNEITILQQGEISIGEQGIEWNDDVAIKQLISYAVGVWMGRYRLDRKGLAIAHPQPTAEELAPYDYNGETVRIDDDAIIPILPGGSPFDDNLPHRIADFVRIAFGEENLTQNLNYMEQCLGETIEQYCLKDFWAYHKKMYQNRPIYWLFSSKKGAFKAIAYMHRMNAYTAEQVRAKYLLPYIDFTQQQVSDLDARAAELSTKERKQLDSLRKQLDELREYHDRLQVVAEDTERTQFDLDDGVVANYAKYGDVLAKIK